MAKAKATGDLPPGPAKGKPEITGQLMTRPSSIKAPDGSGRQVIMVFGLLAVGEGSTLHQSDRQFTVRGQDLAGLGVQLTVLAGPIDLSERTKGLSVDQLLTSPLWKV
jgi:hypothetical protein